MNSKKITTTNTEIVAEKGYHGPRFITPKRYIVWSFDHPIDMADPVQRQWYIKQVLLYGKREDLVQLDWNEIRRVLPNLILPEVIRRLWEDYFASEK